MATANETTNAELEHFVELAYRGRHNSSSTGEQAARKLALTLCDLVPSLDGLALAGLIEYALRIKSGPEAARRVIG